MKYSKGITLVEMLLTVLIFSILAALMVTGIKSIKRSFEAMEEQYKARVLAENILTVLTDELRYASAINLFTQADQPEDFQIIYASPTFGFPTLLELEPAEKDGNYGTLTIIYGPDKTKNTTPFHFSYNPLWLCPVDDTTPIAKWNEDQTCLIFSFGICNENGEIQAAIQDYYIRTLNEE